MRHRQSGRKLNMTGAHRRAMFQNMICSLFRHGRIQTTLAKAKELRSYAEPLITLAGRNDTVANRRLAFARLRDSAVVHLLFQELGPRYKDRPGGYLRVLRNGFRPGDNAPKAVVELVGHAEEQPTDDAAATPAAPAS